MKQKGSGKDVPAFDDAILRKWARSETFESEKIKKQKVIIKSRRKSVVSPSVCRDVVFPVEKGREELCLACPLLIPLWSESAFEGATQGTGAGGPLRLHQPP